MTNAENEARLLAPIVAIEFGPWRMELRGDELAEIEYHRRPVLRAIRPVVRDHDWRTLTPTVKSITSVETAEALTFQLNIGFAGVGVGYAAEVAICLRSNDVTITFDGHAPSRMHTNRIGLIVLHRPDDVGRNVTITAPDQTRSVRAFPTDISPHQPFRNIAAMSWERDCTAYGIEFCGDTFETEDQRNWTDASFKTYSTPLSNPFPIALRTGDRVQQSVRLTASPRDKTAGYSSPETAPAVLTVLSQTQGTVPALGTSSSRSVARLPPVLGLEALAVEVSGDDIAKAFETVRRGRQQAAELGAALDLRIIAASATELGPVMDLLPLEDVVRIGAFSSVSHVTEPAIWEELQSVALRRGYKGMLVTGARSHFTELNRRQEVIFAEADAVTYSITPQMHAREIPHIVESLPIQRETALNALRIGSGKPLHIGPLTLKPRFNAVATTGTHDVLTDDAMATDPLQSENFTAAWLLGSIAALTLPGVESLSYFEVCGPRGFLADDANPTPAFHVLEHLAALRGADVLAFEGAVSGLVLYPVATDAGVVLFAANLTPDPLRTAVRLAHQEFNWTIEIPAWSVSIRTLQ